MNWRDSLSGGDPTQGALANGLSITLWQVEIEPVLSFNNSQLDCRVFVQIL